MGKWGRRDPFRSRRRGVGGGLHRFKAPSPRGPAQPGKCSRRQDLGSLTHLEDARCPRPEGAADWRPQSKSDARPPPLSRTAPHYTGPGRKGVRPGPRHPGAAELKRRAQRPVGTTAPEEGAVLPSGARGGGAGGGARIPGVGRSKGAGLGGSGGGVLGGGDWGWPGDLASWGWGASFCNG